MNIAFYSIVPLHYLKEATTLTILSLAKELKERGHDIIIIAAKKKGLPDYEEFKGIPIYRTGSKNKIFSYTLTLRKIIKKTKIKFEIIHCFSSSPLFVLTGIFSKIILPKARIIHSLKSYSRKKNPKYLYYLLNLAKFVTVPTLIFKDKLMFVKKEKIKVIRSPIDLDKFRPKDKEKLKAKYGYQNKKIIFYYGSLHKHKGVLNLIKAIPLIIKDDLFKNEIKFVFAPRYKETQLETLLIKKLGIQDRVEFISDNICIEEYVALADVVVLPYNSLISTEGNPSCLLEAIACKTPAVTTALPELIEIVHPEVDVLMAKPGDIFSLTSQIKRLLENRVLGEKISNNAYSKITKFGTPLIAKHFIDLYKEA